MYELTSIRRKNNWINCAVMKIDRCRCTYSAHGLSCFYIFDRVLFENVRRSIYLKISMKLNSSDTFETFDRMKPVHLRYFDSNKV